MKFNYINWNWKTRLLIIILNLLGNVAHGARAVVPESRRHFAGYLPHAGDRLQRHLGRRVQCAPCQVERRSRGRRPEPDRPDRDVYQPVEQGGEGGGRRVAKETHGVPEPRADEVAGELERVVAGLALGLHEVDDGDGDDGRRSEDGGGQ